MIEAGAPSTWKSCKCAFRGVPASSGVVMVAPPEVPRNAEGAQSEGRVGGGRPSTPVQRGQQYKHYKGQSPVEAWLCRIIYALASGTCISYRGGASGRVTNS